MSLIPWMEMGWNVVNVEYRLARVAPAPAAVEDCLCALRYLAAQAKTYNIDVNRLVVTGESAGGHLTLTSAMIPESAGLDRQCAGNTPVPKVAAAINWFGITDVADVIDGPNKANLAVTWLGSLPNKDEIARRVSPLTYVRPGLPPILTIHGDKDRSCPTTTRRVCTRRSPRRACRISWSRSRMGATATSRPKSGRKFSRPSASS